MTIYQPYEAFRPLFHVRNRMRRDWNPIFMEDRFNYFSRDYLDEFLVPHRYDVPLFFNRPNPDFYDDFYDETWAPAVSRSYTVLHNDDIGTIWCHENSDELRIVFRNGTIAEFPTRREIDVDTGDVDYVFDFNGHEYTVGIVRAMAFYDGLFDRGFHIDNTNPNRSYVMYI